MTSIDSKIEPSPPSFVSSVPHILNANIATEDIILDKTQSLTIIENDMSSYCEDKESLTKR